jgi:tetratricopeptide (TPR) repeat protein
MSDDKSLLGQYFSQDSGDSNIFDQISNANSSAMMASMVESTSTPDIFIQAREFISPENQTKPVSNEPVVCKIFAQEETKPLKQSASFFDAIGPSKKEAEPFRLGEIDFSMGDSSNEGPFPSPLQGFEDPLDVVNGTESDRAREAWIPSETTRRALIMVATSAPGTYALDKELLTMPGVVLEEDMTDNVTQLVRQLCGEAEAESRKVLTVNDVSQDERGLRELMQNECYRAAVNLTSRLLEMYGQGVKKQGQPSKHTTHSVQFWFTRLALLVKLEAYQTAEAEASVWWDLDKPDLYYQFYPELYGGKPGTIVPFQMRLLIATLPAYLKKFPLALERLYSILAIVRRILKNLSEGKSEDGSLLELSSKERELSRRLWLGREARTLHSIINVALLSKDFTLAIEVLQGLIKSNSSVNQKRALTSALGRVFLQLGDVTNAKKCFEKCRGLKRSETGTLGSSKPDLRELIDRGLLAVANNNFADAYELFHKASLLNPTNIPVVNNKAVCLLYMGQLKNALQLLTSTIQSNPTLALSEALLLNVCTLFELESSRCDQNELQLLKQVAKYKGDSINVACLKLSV